MVIRIIDEDANYYFFDEKETKYLFDYAPGFINPENLAKDGTYFCSVMDLRMIIAMEEMLIEKGFKIVSHEDQGSMSKERLN